MADRQFDYIIAGGGLTGWTAAARLTENADISILVTIMTRVLSEMSTTPPLSLDVCLIIRPVIRNALRLVLHTYGFDIRRQFGELR